MERFKRFSSSDRKTNELTPEGTFDVVMKAKDPYYIAKDIRWIAKNPLGSRWIGFNARGTDGSKYGIHGTNQPSSIGKYISQGCIRMKKNDVEYLFDRIPIGTKVWIVKSKKSFQQLAKEKGAVAYEKANEKGGFSIIISCLDMCT